METNRGKCVCALRAIARERARRVRALGVDGERRFYLSRRRVARIGLHKRRGLRRATRVRTGSPPLSGRNKLISNISRVGGCGRSARAASCADEDDDGESSRPMPAT